MLCLVAQSCPTLCNPVDCSPPGPSVHGDSPGKNTRVGCHALLQGIFPTQGSNPGLPHCRQILYCLSHQGSPCLNTRSLYFLRASPGGSDGKESACDIGDLGSIPEIPWRREWQPTPVFLPGEFHGQRSVAGYSPWGCEEMDTTEQLTLYFLNLSASLRILSQPRKNLKFTGSIMMGERRTRQEKSSSKII